MPLASLLPLLSPLAPSESQVRMHRRRVIFRLLVVGDAGNIMQHAARVALELLVEYGKSIVDGASPPPVLVRTPDGGDPAVHDLAGEILVDEEELVRQGHRVYHEVGHLVVRGDLEGAERGYAHVETQDGTVKPGGDDSLARAQLPEVLHGVQDLLHGSGVLELISRCGFRRRANGCMRRSQRVGGDEASRHLMCTPTVTVISIYLPC